MLLYRCLFTLALPLLLLALLIRVLRGIESLTDFRERLGLCSDLPKGAVIWCHAASNGELNAARVILQELVKSNTLLITCNSTSGRALVQSWGLDNSTCRLAPLDLTWLHRRIARKLDVQKFVLFEADFWPNRLSALEAAGIPLALIGGRISEKSTKGWLRFPTLADRVFGSFDLVCAQDCDAEERLTKLGAHAFGAQISLKSLYQAALDPKPSAKRNTTWLAASTHDGEDSILLQAHQQILRVQPNVKLILAPRHPKRGDAIVALAKGLGLSVAQRSKGAAFETDASVYVADTLGEMDMWYAAAGTCFVAGSLIAKGGHTPYEPLAHGCAIIHGPHLENFARAYEALAAQNGARLCRSSEDIAQAVLDLTNPDTAKAQCKNAQIALSQSDALESVLLALRQLSKN